MEIPTKQLRNGFEMPVYGLGTWMMGGAMHRDLDNDDAADVRAIEVAIEHGVSHIDTAEKYAAGHTETLVGRAIKRFDRDRLFLATKLSAAHAAAPDVKASAEASLRRLGVDHVDLYLIHSFPASVPLEETMGAMSRLVDRGLVRAIGVSNFGSANMARAQAHAEHPIVVNQVHYNLVMREVELDGLTAACPANDVFLMAWRPVRFDGLHEPGNELLDGLCGKYAKTRSQIALNWLISQDHVITLAKTRSEEHLLENLGALGWTMESEDVELLRSSYPGQQDVSDAVPLDA